MTTTVSFGSDESRCSGIIKDGDTPMIGYCIIEPPGESAIAVEGRDIMARGRLDGEAKFYLKGQRILPRSDGMRLFVYGPQGHWQELFIDNRELGQYIDEQGYPYSPKHFFDRYQDIADRTHQ